jgi:hypothetical protein
MCENLSRHRFGALALGAAGFAAVPARDRTAERIL